MKEGFLSIIEEHQAIIYKICKMYRDTKEDQEDLYQEIVLQLWKSYPNFRGDSKVSTWMYRIGLNTAITVFRKNTVQLDYEVKWPAQSTDVDEPGENEERMFEALRKLNKVEKAIITLFLEDCPYKEIAEITGITENYVGVKMSRIKDKLKQLIGE